MALSLCALRKTYTRKGYVVTIDDMIQHPSSKEQMWLLNQGSLNALHARSDVTVGENDEGERSYDQPNI